MNSKRNISTMDVDDEWMQFLLSQRDGGCQEVEMPEPLDAVEDTDSPADLCEDLYISTKTKVLFFNRPIDIQTIFWKIPVIEYWQSQEGVIKKQMKHVSKTPEEYRAYCKKLESVPFYVEHVIKQIDNPEARSIKFKDERKITVGVSKKDIMVYRGKMKNAFYNCFALVFRFYYEGAYREIHAKIFNTGKMEIPGVLTNDMLMITKRMILETIRPHMEQGEPLYFQETDIEDNILINSNFNCGFFIHLDKLYSILRGDKYRIESAYEPCSYPGVKCKFYFQNAVGYDPLLQNGQVLAGDRGQKMSELDDNTKYTQISFMIFRTGSCLIVGNCCETILQFVYSFIKKMLAEEYANIRLIIENTAPKIKKTKLRKKTIYVTREYFQKVVLSRTDDVVTK